MGWRHPLEVWLDPELVFTAVEQHLRRSNRSIGINMEGLFQALDAEGYLLAKDKGRTRARRTLPSGRRPHVLVLRPGDLGLDDTGGADHRAEDRQARPGQTSGPEVCQ